MSFLAGRLGKLKADIDSGNSGNVIEIDTAGNELGVAFSAYNATDKDLGTDDKCILGTDGNGNAFFF